MAMENGFVLLSSSDGCRVLVPNTAGSRRDCRRPAIFQLGALDELPSACCTDARDIAALLKEEHETSTGIGAESWADMSDESSEASSEESSEGSDSEGDDDEDSNETQCEAAWSSVIQDVVHDEPAAQICEVVAAERVAQQRDSWVPQEEPSSNGAELQEFEPLFLVRLTRAPCDLHARLHKGPELEQARVDMEKLGLCTQLPCGAAIFVLGQDEHAAAQQIVMDQCLRLHHIVVQQSLLPLVREAVHALRSRLNVRIRSQETIAYLSGSRAVVAERTFLSELQYLRSPRSVAQSTTEAHGSVNPRRVAERIAA